MRGSCTGVSLQCDVDNRIQDPFVVLLVTGKVGANNGFAP
jgi:hypothetical protein